MIKEESDLYPPFFEKLKTTTNPREFEDYVYFLLKLVGITTIHRYSPTEQAGLPDGIFRCKNLVVIYDATLGNLTSKETQKLNYVNLLKSDQLNVTDKESWDIKSHSKEVWFITRKEKTERDKTHGEVQVKIVSIDSLIKLYIKRLEDIEREEQLVEYLKRIEE